MYSPLKQIEYGIYVGSCYNIPKTIFYLLKADYMLCNEIPEADSHGGLEINHAPNAKTQWPLFWMSSSDFQAMVPRGVIPGRVLF